MEKVCKRINAATDLVRELLTIKSEKAKILRVLNWSCEQPWKGCRCGCCSE